MSYSHVQLSGGFSLPHPIETIISPYCVQTAGGGVAVSDTVYAVSLYQNGVLTATSYQRENGDTLALPPAVIASLLPGECAREYDMEGELVCAGGVTLKRIEIANDSTGQPTTDPPLVIFVNYTTGLAVAAPASFTPGACAVPRPARSVRQYGPALPAAGALNVLPAGGVWREVQAHNRSSRDILLTWTSSSGGSGTLTVPGTGTVAMALTRRDDEGVFLTMVASVDLVGAPVLPTANQLLLNFKN